MTTIGIRTTARHSVAGVASVQKYEVVYFRASCLPRMLVPRSPRSKFSVRWRLTATGQRSTPTDVAFAASLFREACQARFDNRLVGGSASERELWPWSCVRISQCATRVQERGR